MITELQSERKHTAIHHTKLSLKQGVDMEKLIGTPHLFCRYCETREGFIIVPIGNMTLQPDGRVTGYSHPNEGYWKSYEYGTVDSDKGFAFVGAGNRFIPSSTWQQTFAEMPIGFYCGDPELPQKLCLVPNAQTYNDAEIVYVIATCLRFYEKTIPKLLKDLFAEGIEPARIKVVVNGSKKDEDKIINGVSYAFTKHDSFELSALYEAPLRWQFDYAMLIHDTNNIYPGFRRRVENFNHHLQWDYLPSTPMARCLLGLYAHDFLLRTNAWLGKMDKIDKGGAIITEVAGEFLHRAKTVLVMSDPETNEGARQTEWREVADFYNAGTPRVRRVFPAINLHKFTHIDTSDGLSL